jgi:cell division protein FtsN
VQVSSSESKTAADEVREQLRQYELHPVIGEAQVRGKSFYRVRLGPYASLQEAAEIAEWVKKPPLGFYDSFIP